MRASTAYAAALDHLRRDIEAMAEGGASVGEPARCTPQGTPYTVFINGYEHSEAAPIRRAEPTETLFDLAMATIQAVKRYRETMGYPVRLLWRDLPTYEEGPEGPCVRVRLAFERVSVQDAGYTRIPVVAESVDPADGFGDREMDLRPRPIQWTPQRPTEAWVLYRPYGDDIHAVYLDEARGIEDFELTKKAGAGSDGGAWALQRVILRG